MTSLIRKAPYLPYLCALAISLLYFLFQFHHMQQYFDSDQIVYLNNIKHALKPGATCMYYPHHLHMESGGKLFHEFMMEHFAEAGFTDVVVNNRLRSILFACIGIFFAVLFLFESTGRLFWGILGGILIGFCHGYLSYATKVDTAIFPASAMIALVWIIQRIERSKRRPVLLALPAGIILFLGVMFHQYMGFACVLSVIALLLPPLLFRPSIPAPFTMEKKEKGPEIEENPRARYLTVTVMALSGIILIGAGFFYTGESVYNLPFSGEERRESRSIFGNTLFQRWIMGYAVLDTWGKGFKNFNPKNPFRGFTKSFLSSVPGKNLSTFDYDYDYKINEPENEKGITHNQVAYFTLITLAGCLIFFPFMWVRYRRTFFFILSGFIVFALYVTYWEAHYYEFWVVPCLLLCLLAVLLLNLLGEKLSPLLSRFSQYPFFAYIIFFIIIVSFHNIRFHAAPYSRNRVFYGISSRWSRDYTYGLVNRDIYKNPDNVYADVYKD
ncbi:MAG: hypothetical protein JW881_13095 [Spirochaetales bacterium]|nr:hypothetical protein [Spirochaetales bacterium]